MPKRSRAHAGECESARASAHRGLGRRGKFMKMKKRSSHRRFELRLICSFCSGTDYYIERIARLEAMLARRPRTLQIDLIGSGALTADFALLFRSVILGRSPVTEIVTRA